MVRVVVSCEKFASDQKCFNNKNVRQNISFVFSDFFVLFISFDRSSNFVEFARQRSMAKCSARLATPHKNNIQHIVTKCYVLLGEKFGSFDPGLITICYLLNRNAEEITASVVTCGATDFITHGMHKRSCDQSWMVLSNYDHYLETQRIKLVPKSPQ